MIDRMNDNSIRLTVEQKAMIKALKELAPKGGQTWMKTVSKLYHQNLGSQGNKNKKPRDVINEINRLILHNNHLDFEFSRGNDDMYLHISLKALTEAKRLNKSEPSDK